MALSGKYGKASHGTPVQGATKSLLDAAGLSFLYQKPTRRSTGKDNSAEVARITKQARTGATARRLKQQAINNQLASGAARSTNEANSLYERAANAAGAAAAGRRAAAAAKKNQKAAARRVKKNNKARSKKSNKSYTSRVAKSGPSRVTARSISSKPKANVRSATPTKSRSVMAKTGAKIRARNPNLSTKEVRARARGIISKRGGG